MKNISLLFAFYLLFVSCKQDKKTVSTSEKVKTENSGDFPKEKPISDFKNTDFVIALEKDFPQNKNAVYAPTVLFAWDEVRKIFNSQNFISEIPNQDFKLLNSSKSHENSLNKDEYEISVDNKENQLKIKAFFNKSLPFEMDFEKIDSMNFKKNSVKGFGIIGFNEDLINQIKIVYFKNDKDFIIKLFPKDLENEILLLKSNKNFKNFAEVLKDFSDKEKLGFAISKDSLKSWKNEFRYDDELQIPNLAFNISKIFKEFSGLKIKDDRNNITKIDSIFQRNAFTLNEKGAKAESEALYAAAKAEVSNDEDIPKPKHLIFDDNFYIFLKKKNSKNPYFAIKIVDSELMTRN